MKHSLYVRQKFGNVSFYPIKKTKWLHTDVDTDADFDLSYSIPLGILRPKDAFKCWCKVINRNSDGVFVQFKDKYGPVKLSRISNLRDDELFIPANYDERGFSYSNLKDQKRYMTADELLKNKPEIEVEVVDNRFLITFKTLPMRSQERYFHVLMRKLSKLQVSVLAGYAETCRYKGKTL